MRLLIATLDAAFARRVRELLYAEDSRWDARMVSRGAQALDILRENEIDLLLLHACLPDTDGLCVLQTLRAWRLCCPPRVLLLCEPEQRRGQPVDASAPLYAAPRRVCALLAVLCQKPVPTLARPQLAAMTREAERLLDALHMPRALKGYRYAAWLVARLAFSSMLADWPMGRHYADCADACLTSAAAVERCLRRAVECVFTQGSLRGIERYFGATVDPERGKPTNRAFLLQAAQQARAAYSRAETRLPNSIDTHQSPAAPTTV